MDTQEITKKLDALRKKAEDIKQQRSKLEGEEQALQNRISEIEKRAKDDTGEDISALPGMIEEYEKKILDYVQKIENILGAKNG